MSSKVLLLDQHDENTQKEKYFNNSNKFSMKKANNTPTIDNNGNSKNKGTNMVISRNYREAIDGGNKFARSNRFFI